MKTFELWCVSGNRYFVNADLSYIAILFVQSKREIVSTWSPAPTVPLNATVYNA